MVQKLVEKETASMATQTDEHESLPPCVPIDVPIAGKESVPAVLDSVEPALTSLPPCVLTEEPIADKEIIPTVQEPVEQETSSLPPCVSTDGLIPDSLPHDVVHHEESGEKLPQDHKKVCNFYWKDDRLYYGPTLCKYYWKDHKFFYGPDVCKFYWNSPKKIVSRKVCTFSLPKKHKKKTVLTKVCRIYRPEPKKKCKFYSFSTKI
eukprot:XP_017950425.1 PREDICTED: uncharacterized protein LOC100494805 [Xenopus tropicalis]